MHFSTDRKTCSPYSPCIMARPDRRASENNAQRRGGRARAMATTAEKSAGFMATGFSSASNMCAPTGMPGKPLPRHRKHRLKEFELELRVGIAKAERNLAARAPPLRRQIVRPIREDDLHQPALERNRHPPPPCRCRCGGLTKTSPERRLLSSWILTKTQLFLFKLSGFPAALKLCAVRPGFHETGNQKPSIDERPRKTFHSSYCPCFDARAVGPAALLRSSQGCAACVRALFQIFCWVCCAHRAWSLRWCEPGKRLVRHRDLR